MTERKDKMEPSKFPLPEDANESPVAEFPVSCWDAEICDGECLSRELDKYECRAIQKVFADFFYKVENDNLVVAEETPAFDDRADEFIKYAQFDDEALSDAKEHGIAVFFGNPCKPSLIVCRMGFLFNDPEWPVDLGATNVSFVPWSLFAHFSAESCDVDGTFCLMQDEEYAKSSDVYDEPRAMFDKAMHVCGNLPHKFNFAALGFVREDIDELFANVKRALLEGSYAIPTEENLPTPDSPTPDSDEVWG